MINNNELMFGNIINRQYFNPNPKGQTIEKCACLVCDIKEVSILITLSLIDNSKMRLNNGLFFPVITDEYWLEKLGFNKQSKTNQDYKHSKYSHIRVCLCRDNKFHLITKFQDDLLSEPLVEFVHQLQNIFFCITAEKLECVY